MNTTTQSFLVADNICLSFGGISVLKRVSFSVDLHSITAIIGPNGAGKSSMLNVINGFYTPQFGKIHFCNHSWHAIKPFQAARLGISRTFQNIGLFKSMSVLDNILSGQVLHARSSLLEQAFGIGRVRQEERSARDFAAKLMRFFDIETLAHRSVDSLPYGTQKLVELAKATAMRPKLLLLDEPMAGMNKDEKALMGSFVQTLRKEYDLTILLIEHDMSIVMNLSDHIVVLDFGQKIAEGTPHAVSQNPEVIQAYLGEPIHDIKDA